MKMTRRNNICALACVNHRRCQLGFHNSFRAQRRMLLTAQRESDFWGDGVEGTESTVCWQRPRYSGRGFCASRPTRIPVRRKMPQRPSGRIARRCPDGFPHANGKTSAPGDTPGRKSSHRVRPRARISAAPPGGATKDQLRVRVRRPAKAPRAATVA
jgi:hypothetical protein